MDEINVQIEETEIGVQVTTPGVSRLIDLDDVPANYEDGKFLKSTASGFVFAVPEGGGDMLMSVYDTNGNGIVDLTEGVRVLSDFPTSYKAGDLIVVNGDVYINI